MSDSFFVGQSVPLTFHVMDADGVLENPTAVSLVVRLPDGSTEEPTYTNPSAGVFMCDYFPLVSGRFVVTFASSGDNAGAIEDVFDVAPAAAAGLTLADLRTYLGDSSSQWSDEELGSALAAEQHAQGARCRLDPYSMDLTEALRRRVARNLAMRKVPLGIAVSGDVEVTRVSGYDGEIRRLEGPYRRVVVG